MPELSTIMVHEIKARGQELHDGKHFVDLLTSDDAELRSKVASSVAQAFGYAVSAAMIVMRIDNSHTCPSPVYFEYMCFNLLCHHCRWRKVFNMASLAQRGSMCSREACLCKIKLCVSVRQLSVLRKT